MKKPTANARHKRLGIVIVSKSMDAASAMLAGKKINNAGTKIEEAMTHLRPA
jgi:hypothetical protein